MAENLHTPEAKSFTTGVNDIMKAYNTQSKIQLYDDDSALSNNEMSGVQGRNIPLSKLRPHQPYECQEDGSTAPSKSRMAEDLEARNSIMKAYRRMNGVEETEEDGYDEETYSNQSPSDRISNVKRFKAGYIEDMPESDEGLLDVLELTIRNARANLEMLESLYAALSPSS